MAIPVLLCRIDGNFGGVERHILSLARNLTPERFHPIIVSIANHGELERQAIEGGFETAFIPMKSRMRLWSASNELKLIAQERGAGILHTFGLRSNLLAWMTRRSLKIPWVIRLPNLNYTDYRGPIRGWISQRANNALIRRADALQVISPQLEEYIRGWRHTPKRIYLVPNGVDIQRFTPTLSTVEARRWLSLPEEGPVIGSVGRLDCIKGFDLLIAAFAALFRRANNARLLLVGDGPERDNLYKQADRRGVGGRVIFTGFASDVRPYLSAMDLFVCSSRSEGVPFAMMEAMAMGVPCVAAQVGGVESVVRHGEDGLLFPAMDANALIHTIGEMIAHPERAESLGAAGRTRIEERFSAETMAQGVQSIYEDLLQS